MNTTSKIVTEMIDDQLREVKYLESYNRQSFQDCAKILHDEHYDIFDFSREMVTFYNESDHNDFVKLTCAAPIRVAWVKSYYPDYFKTLFSPAYIKDHQAELSRKLDDAVNS